MYVGVGNFRERPEDGEEIVSVVAAERTGNVFPDDVFRVFSIRCFPHFSDDARHLKEQMAALSVVKAGLFSGDRQVLARATAADDIYRLDRRTVDVKNASQMLHAGESLRRYLDRKRLDLGGPCRFDAAHGRRQRSRSGSVK